MLAFKVTQDDVRIFMRQLLQEGAFYSLEVRGVEIAALMRHRIDGAAGWETLQSTVCGLIKGQQKPKLIKVTFALPEAEAAALHPNAAALFLNIHYENDEILCTTGASEKNFALDKSVAAAWDDYMRRYIAERGIVVSMFVD